MKILGIETTCDETSVAIVEDGFEILSHLINSQVALHRQFGGVVPELACRRHIDVITPLLDEAMQSARLSFQDIDVISVAKGPGLIGALLIGLNFAKGLAWSIQKPLIGINHIEAHLYAAMMSQPQEALLFPALGVVLSGGHTSLVLVDKIGSYRLLGETVDDAIGEAFDKVAKILGLPYPGGPEIELLAKGGDPLSFPFKSSRVKGQPLDFSFSGIKTSVLYAVKGNTLQKEMPAASEKKNIAASFQRAVFQDVIEKIELALKTYPVKALFLGGGVTQNKELRHMLQKSVSLPLFWPSGELCLDNAAMIAGLGYHKYLENSKDELFILEPETRIPFER